MPSCMQLGTLSQALYRRGLAGLGCGLLQQDTDVGFVAGGHGKHRRKRQAKEDLREAAKLEPRPRCERRLCRKSSLESFAVESGFELFLKEC